MKTYLDALSHVMNSGIQSSDRTGTGTLSTFGLTMRFDLSKGFPLVTTKKLHLKSIIHELLWFLKGDTNNSSLKKEGVRIWDEWSGPYGALGPIYGSAWRYWKTTGNDRVEEIRIREDRDADFIEPEIVWHEPIDCDLNTDDIWAIGEEIGKNRIYTVQTSSGYISTISRPNWKSMRKPEAFDRYAKNNAGVGFLGAKVDHEPRLYNLWRNMILRCYDPDHPTYASYGGSGVTVSPIWHSFERFCATIASVPFFHLWLDQEKKVHLDKDYFGSRVYSPSTTMFMLDRENLSMGNGNALQVRGKVYESWAHFEEMTGIRSDYLRARLREGKTCKGYKPEDVYVLTPKEGHIYRRKRFHDQIQGLIDTIAASPDSRRLIVSGWNPSDLEDMALPPCHTMWQVRILDGKVNLQLYQRSGDMFLGIPFNIASYAMLTHMIAHVTGYEVGEFIHTIGDAHIYANHVDQVALQLTREPRELPALKIARDVKSIDDFRFEDFVIEGYDPHPAIKAPVAV